MGENSLPDYGSVVSVNRLVRTRLLGGVGAGGEKPPATRLESKIVKKPSQHLVLFPTPSGKHMIYNQAKK
jgi:hypothetical protein